MKGRKIVLPLFLFVFLFLLPFVMAASTVNLTANMTNITGDALIQLISDRNSTHSMLFYSDNSKFNPNAYITLCSNDISEYAGKYVSLSYAGNNGTDYQEIVRLRPQIGQVSGNCTTVDVDISRYRAFYPGIPIVQIVELNVTNVTWNVSVLNETNNETYQAEASELIDNSSVIAWAPLSGTGLFNGSYKIGIVTMGNNATTLLVEEARDSDGGKISLYGGDKDYLFVSIEVGGDTSGSVRTTVGEVETITGMGVIKVYVNRLLSEELIPISWCSNITIPGYYIFNSSIWNYFPNASEIRDGCIDVSTNNTIIDFADFTLDGSVNTTENNRTCGLLIRDSENITVYAHNIQEFHKGVCIQNSRNIDIQGSITVSNNFGIYVNSSSTVTFEDVSTSGNDTYNALSDIYVEGNTTVYFDRLSTESANVTINITDAEINTVRVADRPTTTPTKDGESTVSLEDTYLDVLNTSADGKIYIKFSYSAATAQAIVADLASVWRLTNITDGNNTNTSVWIEVGKDERYCDLCLYSPWVYDFSIFAPFALESTGGEDEPPPPPPPVGGAGGTAPPPILNITEREPTQEEVLPEINLELDTDRKVLQQGEVWEFDYSVENLGEIGVVDLVVEQELPPKWEGTEDTISSLDTEEIKEGSLLLKVWNNAPPNVYQVIVKVTKDGLTIDSEVLEIRVIPRVYVAKIDIVEAPTTIYPRENRWEDLSLLFKNTGDVDLYNITLDIRRAEDCIEAIEGSYNLSSGKPATGLFTEAVPGEEKQVTYRIRTKRGFEECRGILVVSSNEGVLAFSPLVIRVAPGLPTRFYILPIVFILWSVVLLWWVRRQYL